MNTKAAALFTCLATLGCLSTPAHASDPDDPRNRAQSTESPYFFIEQGDPSVDHLPLQSTDVRFDIAGVIADVTVRQVYKNLGSRPINVRYIFPASVRAAVHGMRMTIGDQTVEAVIQEREQAKRTFEQAKREGKTASLLEQKRPNVFSMRLANIMPGDRIEVELRYSELLVPTDGVYEFVYPTVVGPRYGGGSDASTGDDDFVSAPYTDELEDPTYTFGLHGRIDAGVPLQRLTVPSHRVLDRRPRPNIAELTLADGQQNSGDRDFILRYELAGKHVAPGLLLYEGTGKSRGEKFFMLTVQPPARVLPEMLPSREYVFVLDVSGSMHGFPLDTAKRVMRDLARGLRPRDRFNVMLFSGGSRLLWPQSRAATAKNLDEAMAMIDSREAGGGTEMLSALQRALALPTQAGVSRSFIVVTDGYVAAERELFAFIRAHLGEANVYSFGIGTSVNRYLIDGIARAGLGEAFVITDPGESRATAKRFRDYIASPVLTDIKLHADGFEIYDLQPAAIPDVLAARPVVVHGKWRGKATGSLRLTGVTGAGAFEQRIDVADVQPDPRNAALKRLWARTRIAEVSDFSFGHETDAEREQVTALGLEYNLLTKYTSFVAVSRNVRNRTGDSQDVNQPLPLPLGISNSALGGIVGAPEPELWLLLLVFAVLMFLGTIHGAGTARKAP